MKHINLPNIRRSRLFLSLLLIVSFACASYGQEAGEPSSADAVSANEDVPQEEYAGEFAVIELSGQLNLYHESTGHLLEQAAIHPIMVLSGQTSGQGGQRFILEIQATQLGREVHAIGSVQMTDRRRLSGSHSQIIRFELPIDSKLPPGQETQVIDRAEDGLNVRVSLTATVSDPAAHTEWLFGQVEEATARHYRFISRNWLHGAAIEGFLSARQHVDALVEVLDGTVSPVNARKLSELFGRVVEAIEANEMEEAAELFEEIDRVGIRVREDLEAWKAIGNFGVMEATAE